MKIMLDPGHGIQNRGFVNIPGFLYASEGKCNYYYATEFLAPTLRSRGITVGITKDRMDIDPTLQTRGAMARGYDLLLSLHSNAANGNAQGTEVWDSTNPKESLPDLGKALSKGISSAIGTIDRGVKYRKNSGGQNYYGILRYGQAKHNMIIEHAFHDNYIDAQRYVSNLQKIADVTADILVDFFILDDKPVDYNIIGQPSATLSQVEAWAKTKTDNPEFVGLAPIYYRLFKQIGLDPVLGYAQMAHETGFLYKVKSAAGLDASYHNPCGLKVTQGGGDYQATAHKRFKDWDEGITAHRDHLALYAGLDGYPDANSPDPRHFNYLHGRAKTLSDLSGKWAPSGTYADKIRKYIDEIRAMPVSQPTGNNDPSDWAKEDWQWGIDIGITDGSNPKGACTREQVITMIRRAYNSIK